MAIAKKSSKKQMKSAAQRAALDHENRTPTPERRAASAARKAGNEAAARALTLGPFELEFCFQMAHTDHPVAAYQAALIRTGQDLDLSNYEVHVRRETEKMPGPDGKPVDVLVKVRRIIVTRGGMTVKEEDVIYGRAMNMLYYPEIREEIQRLKTERAAAIKVSAESIAAELDIIAGHAIATSQLQAAVAARTAKAKMFGLDAGPGDGEAPKTPVAEVRINIRDCTKAKEE